MRHEQTWTPSTCNPHLSTMEACLKATLSEQKVSQSFSYLLNPFKMATLLQCRHSNHELYGFIFTLLVFYFHLFCSYFLHFFRTDQSHPWAEVTAQTCFLLFSMCKTTLETLFHVWLYMYSIVVRDGIRSLRSKPFHSILRSLRSKK